jgi:hypothetical protein
MDYLLLSICVFATTLLYLREDRKKSPLDKYESALIRRSNTGWELMDN